MSTTYTIQQDGEPIENGDFASLEEARQGMAALETELGWRNLRIVKNIGLRTNLSGRLLTGADAHEVVAVGAEGLRVSPTGGTGFHVSLDGEFLGSMTFGSLDTDGQYEQDDDEVIDAARERFGVSGQIAGVVR